MDLIEHLEGTLPALLAVLWASQGGVVPDMKAIGCDEQEPIAMKSASAADPDVQPGHNDAQQRHSTGGTPGYAVPTYRSAPPSRDQRGSSRLLKSSLIASLPAESRCLEFFSKFREPLPAPSSATSGSQLGSVPSVVFHQPSKAAPRRTLRLQLGTAALLPVSQAAELMPMDDKDARAWLEREGLVRTVDTRRLVVWGDVLDRIKAGRPTTPQPKQRPHPTKRLRRARL
jgi:hypothetical protein